MPVADSAEHEDRETMLGFLTASFCITMRSFALLRSRAPKKLCRVHPQSPLGVQKVDLLLFILPQLVSNCSH